MRPRSLFAVSLAALAVILTPQAALAADARWAVGAPSGRLAAVAAQLPGARTLVPGRALVVTGARPQVRGASYVTRLDGGMRKLASAGVEPYRAQQWYLDQDRAWDFWRKPPLLPSVKVAVVDTGLDMGHPEFAGRVAAGKSFVGGSWSTDTDGHGTYVAGLIAADPANGVGIAGLAPNVSLLVAKVSEPDGVSLDAEVRAIVWAVRQGARVINLSIGGVRDPGDRGTDRFSGPERDAVAFARSRGVVVVAAVGNGTDSPVMPWRFANWPAAFPHVIGVGALRRDGSVPPFSNRDPFYVDLAAPGQDVISTIPRGLVDPDAGCADPYSLCGIPRWRTAKGTSFAAPQVSAAAALLIGTDPTLTPDRVAWLLERSAADVTSSRCATCGEGRDALTGWGRLDVRAALELLKRGDGLPPADVLEPNDDAGPAARPFGRPRTIAATLDRWDDPTDVYAIRLQRGQTLLAELTSALPLPPMRLWPPGTRKDARGTLSIGTRELALARDRLAFRARVAGTYFLELRAGPATRERQAYELAVSTQRASG